MGLLDVFKTKEEKVEFPLSLKATARGRIVEMKDIPDPVFSGGMVGPCIGIEPTDSSIVAPCNGKIIQLSDTLHAFGIEGDGGVQILVHIGIDTVEMKGDGFEAKVKVGDLVKAGQTIVEVDFDKVKEAGHPTVVITIVANASNYSKVEFVDKESVILNDDIATIDNV